MSIRTSSLTISECSELLEFVQAWAAERGVEIQETQPRSRSAAAE